jgi:hypothetical protein
VCCTGRLWTRRDKNLFKFFAENKINVFAVGNKKLANNFAGLYIIGLGQDVPCGPQVLQRFNKMQKCNL